ERGPWPPAVPRTDGRSERGEAGPFSSRRDVPGEGPQGGEADRAPRRADAHAVHPGTAHDGDPPPTVGPRSKDREGVVADDVPTGPSAFGQGALDAALVRSEVRAGQAVHADRREGSDSMVETSVHGRGG